MTIDRDAYAYCERPHPGGDAEAKDWHRRYHKTLVQSQCFVHGNQIGNHPSGTKSGTTREPREPLG